jgi:hypothetical protein
MCEFIFCNIESVKACIVCADPNVSVAIFEHTVNKITSDSLVIISVVFKLRKFLAPRIKHIQPPTPSANPQTSVIVLNYCLNEIMTDAMLITRFTSVGDEFIEIVTTQSILCAKPQKFCLVLNHAKNGTMRQSFVGVDLFEFSILILRINAETNQNKE